MRKMNRNGYLPQPAQELEDTDKSLEKTLQNLLKHHYEKMRE